MDSVSGSIHSDGVTGSGGETLFSFDPMQAMSRRRRNKKLEALKCWPQVKHMLDNGTPIAEIVHYIQVTRKEYTSVKATSLGVMINQWLGNLANRNRLLDHRIPVRHLNLINSNQERIEPIDAMNMLFAVQMDRVLMAYEKEKNRKSPDKENTGNLRLAMDMLASLNSMQTTDPRNKMSTSAPTNEQRMDGTLAQMDRIKKMFEERWGGTAAKVLMDPDSRNRLFNAVHKIRKTSSINMSELIQKNSEQADKVGGTQVIEVSNDSIIDSEFSDIDG